MMVSLNMSMHHVSAHESVFQLIGKIDANSSWSAAGSACVQPIGSKHPYPFSPFTIRLNATSESPSSSRQHCAAFEAWTAQQIIRRYVKFRGDGDQNIAADGFGFTAFDAAELGRGYADPFGKVLLRDKRGLAQIPDALPRRLLFLPMRIPPDFMIWFDYTSLEATLQIHNFKTENLQNCNYA